MNYVHCGYCGGSHSLALCPHTWAGSAARNNLRCGYCGSDQHDVSRCPRTAGGQGLHRAAPAGAFRAR